MTPETLGWFSAGAMVIGSLVSVFKPDNLACPIDLPPNYRAALCAILGGIQVALQSVYGGVPIIEAIATAGASVLTVLFVHGHTVGDPKP